MTDLLSCEARFSVAARSWLHRSEYDSGLVISSIGIRPSSEGCARECIDVGGRVGLQYVFQRSSESTRMCVATQSSSTRSRRVSYKVSVVLSRRIFLNVPSSLGSTPRPAAE